jgi:casein kinase II subunit beta
MYHFETIAEVTIGKPASSRSARFESVSRQSHGPFVLNYLARHNWLAPVERSFFDDPFNTFGIEAAIPEYALSIRVIRGEAVDPIPALDRIAEATYALLHARFILTPEGLRAMRRKYEAGVFGECPRFRCAGQHLLPVGLACDPGAGTAKLFCPRCRDVYASESDIDGAAFGTSFPHFFMQMNRDLKFPKRADQMRYEFCGIPLAPGADIAPQRVLRDRSVGAEQA